MLRGTTPPVRPFKKALSLTPTWSGDRTVNLDFDDRFAPIRAVATVDGANYANSGIQADSSSSITVFEPKDTPIEKIVLVGGGNAYPYSVDLTEIASLQGVEELDFGILRFSESIEILSSLPNLKIIRTGYFNNLFESDGTSKMAGWKSLEQIYGRGDTTLWYFNELAHLPLKIIELDRSWCSGFEGFENLTTLEIVRIIFTRNAAAPNLYHFRNLNKLYSLNLTNTSATGSLIDLANCSELQAVTLTDNSNISGGGEVVKYMPKLRYLNLDRCGFTQVQLDDLVAQMVEAGNFFTGSGKTLIVTAQTTGETFSTAGLANVDMLRNSYGWTVIY